MKPSPHHKGTAWPYGVITEIPSPRSYVVDTPTRIIRRNRVHVRPAAPPPSGALIPRKWQEQFDRHRDIESQRQHHPNVVPYVTTMVPTVSSSVDVSACPIVPSSPEIVTTQAQSSPQVQQSRVETKSPIITKSGRSPRQIPYCYTNCRRDSSRAGWQGYASHGSAPVRSAAGSTRST